MFGFIGLLGFPTNFGATATAQTMLFGADAKEPPKLQHKVTSGCVQKNHVTEPFLYQKLFKLILTTMCIKPMFLEKQNFLKNQICSLF